jgi:hypothetical protein
LSKEFDPEQVDEDNPEWIRADFRTALRFEQMPMEFQATIWRCQQDMPRNPLHNKTSNPP